MCLKKLFYLLFLCVLTQSLNENVIISGPGLKPVQIIMPARYFFINFTHINAQSYTPELNKKLVVEIDGRSSASKHCRVWVNKLDRKDGTFIVRYKIYETCFDFSIHVYYDRKGMANSPYKFKGEQSADNLDSSEQETVKDDESTFDVENDTQSTNYNVSSPATSTASSAHRKRQANDEIANTISLIVKKLENPDDEYDAIGKNIAAKLRNMTATQ